MKKLLGFLSIILLASCNNTGLIESSVLPEPNMRVNSYTADCTGEMTGTCLLVQEGDDIGTETWKYFYYAGSIEGFNYENGFVYDLLVEKTEINSPPQDGSAYSYRLKRIISKVRQSD